jgi:hypothetical protein
MSVHPIPPGAHPATTTASIARPYPTGRIRVAGLLLAGGATAWAVALVVLGDRVQEGVHVLDTVTGMAFLLGVAALTWTVLVTRATGPGAGRVIPVVLLVLLAGAFALNAASFGYATHDEFPLPLMVLDACWPLGQLVVLVMGVLVAARGRFTGLLRWQPLLCGLWFPVSMLAQVLLGPAGSVWVSAAWLLLAHVLLGVRLLVHPAGASVTAPMPSPATS